MYTYFDFLIFGARVIFSISVYLDLILFVRGRSACLLIRLSVLVGTGILLILGDGKLKRLGSLLE